MTTNRVLQSLLICGLSALGVNAQMVQLNLYWSDDRSDNVLAAAGGASEKDMRATNYRFIRPEAAFISSTKEPGMVPLNLYWSWARFDNVLAAEGGVSAKDHLATGYQYIRTEGYIYPTQQLGTVPLNLYWSEARQDNVLAVAGGASALDHLATNYRFIRTEGYVFPTNVPRPSNCAVPWWSQSYRATGTDATWMTDNYALLCNKALREIAIPGSHDTGTFGVTSTWLRGTTLTNPDEVFAPDLVPNKADLMRAISFVPDIVEGWARTQDRPVRDQLADGIRYLDIRVCVDGFGNILTCHSLYAAPVDEILIDTANFLAGRPGEVVILAFNHFWDGAFQRQNNVAVGSMEGLRAEKWAELVALINKRLGGMLAPNTFNPSTKLSALLGAASAQGTNQAIVVFDRDTTDHPSQKDPAIWSRQEAQTWLGDQWRPDSFKAGTLNILNNAAKTNDYKDKFYAVRASVTPTEFVTKMIDPSSTFPRTNLQLADQTNPIVLGWLKNEWTSLPVNLIWADYYNRTDLVKLAKFRNGIQVDWSGSKLGQATAWGTWRSPLSDSYGRGAGVPLTCNANEDQQGLLCYPKCAAGYTGTATICATSCPAGWRTDPLTCWRDVHITSADNSACPWYDVCGLTFARNCSKCPAGYVNDGCTCRRDAQVISRTYDRGVGRPIHTCPSGYERDPNGLLCYTPCKEGYYGVGPVCWPNN